MCIWFPSRSIRRRTRRRFCAATRSDCTRATGRWDFLTGPEATLYPLIKNGFKLGVSDGAEELGVPVHSTRAALVDRKGEIRGYYDMTAPDAVTNLLADTTHLLREQPR